jgi:hypothetical protein
MHYPLSAWYRKKEMPGSFPVAAPVCNLTTVNGPFRAEAGDGAVYPALRAGLTESVFQAG